MKTVYDYIEYKEDLSKVRHYLDNKGIMWSLAECQIMWEWFSDSYCAQFLSVSDELLEQFLEWLND